MTVYIAVKTAMFRYEGKRVMVKKGRTTIDEGHPILAAHPELFKALVPDWSSTTSESKPGRGRRVEDASDDPDRPRRRGRPKLPRDEEGKPVHAVHAETAEAGTDVAGPPSGLEFP